MEKSWPVRRCPPRWGVGGGGGVNLLAVEPTFCFFTKSGSSSFVRKCRKSLLARATGRRVNLRPGTSFLHINGFLWWIGFLNKLVDPHSPDIFQNPGRLIKRTTTTEEKSFKQV